jgi:hypothetical protein
MRERMNDIKKGVASKGVEKGGEVIRIREKK